MTSEERKQNRAKIKRAATIDQYEMAWDMLTHNLSDTEILLAVEREYFVNRKQAEDVLERARKDLHDLNNW